MAVAFAIGTAFGRAHPPPNHTERAYQAALREYRAGIAQLQRMYHASERNP